MDGAILTTSLVILSVVFTVVGVVPYIYEVVKGKTKPRVVSWLTWSVLTTIACVAAFVDGQYPTAILLLFASLETLAIVILGWHLGDKKAEGLDVICLSGAGVGIILWHVFDSPAIAVIATIVIDLVGGIPTLVHSWKKPFEETWSTFFMAFLGASCTLLVISDWRITAFAYPLYLVIINLLFSVVIIGRGQHVKNVR
jgi:hypothetical protein